MTRLTRLAWTVPSVALLLVSGGLCAGAATPTPTPAPSAIGNEIVASIAVSPAYLHTGTVVAVSGALGGCSSTASCLHVWISRDGGNTWKKAAGQGWNGTHPVVAVDGAGHETIFATSSNGILRSDDYGNTFKPVGAGGGTPTPEPAYAGSQAVAVAGKADYVMQGGGASRHVAGSGGSMSDSSFGFSPSFPRSGANPPALLGGTDARTGQPAVETCDANLTCASPIMLNGAGSGAGPPVMHLSSNFADDGTAFAQTTGGIFKTSTGGRSFTPVNIGQPGATATTTPAMALAPHTAYAAVLQVFTSGASRTRSGGVYRSDDAGATWRLVGSHSPLDDGAVAVAVAPDGRLFASYLTDSNQGGMLCSTDGSTWRTSCPPVGGAAAAQSASHEGATACTPAPCSGNASSATSAATAQGGQGGVPGTGGSGGSRVGSAQTPSSKPWLIPLLLAAVLAAIAVVVRRRPGRHPRTD